MNAQAEQMKSYVRELSILVEGRGKDKDALSLSQVKSTARRGIAVNPSQNAKVRKTLSVPAKKQTIKETGSHTPHLKGIRPESIIPMAEMNFKEF
jgi:hypothetical protein